MRSTRWNILISSHTRTQQDQMIFRALRTATNWIVGNSMIGRLPSRLHRRVALWALGGVLTGRTQDLAVVEMAMVTG